MFRRKKSNAHICSTRKQGQLSSKGRVSRVYIMACTRPKHGSRRWPEHGMHTEESGGRAPTEATQAREKEDVQRAVWGGGGDCATTQSSASQGPLCWDCVTPICNSGEIPEFSPADIHDLMSQICWPSLQHLPH